MPQIGSRTEYMIPTFNIFVLLSHSNLILKCSLADGFWTRFNNNSEVANFLLGHPVKVYLQNIADDNKWRKGSERDSMDHQCDE